MLALLDEMWRLLERLGVHKGTVHPLFGVKPEEQIATMLQQRWVWGLVSGHVGACSCVYIYACTCHITRTLRSTAYISFTSYRLDMYVDS